MGAIRGTTLHAGLKSSLEKEGDHLEWPTHREFFREYATSRAFELISADLELLGIVFNRYFAESELIPQGVNAAIQQLGNHGLVYRDPDTPAKLWLRLTEDLGRPEDRVIVRDNGTYTYRMPDIAYHLDKFSRGYDLMVDMFGSDHIDTCRDVEAALEALLGAEGVGSRLRTVLHQFVTLLRDGDKVKMSTRAGNFVTLQGSGQGGRFRRCGQIHLPHPQGRGPHGFRPCRRGFRQRREPGLTMFSTRSPGYREYSGTPMTREGVARSTGELPGRSSVSEGTGKGI